MPALVRLSVTQQANEVVLAVAGRLDAQGAGTIWNATLRAGTAARGRAPAFDLSDASFCDLDGATLQAAVEAAHGGQATLRGATERVAALLARARTGPYVQKRDWPLTARRPTALPPRPGGPVLLVRSIAAGAGLESRGLQWLLPDGSVHVDY